MASLLSMSSIAANSHPSVVWMAPDRQYDVNEGQVNWTELFKVIPVSVLSIYGDTMGHGAMHGWYHRLFAVNIKALLNYTELHRVRAFTANITDLKVLSCSGAGAEHEVGMNWFEKWAIHGGSFPHFCTSPLRCYILKEATCRINDVIAGDESYLFTLILQLITCCLWFFRFYSFTVCIPFTSWLQSVTLWNCQCMCALGRVITGFTEKHVAVIARGSDS